MPLPKALKFRSLSLGAAPPTTGFGVVLRDFKVREQDRPYWCWAAAALSVHEFYKGDLFSKQCDIVTDVLKSQLNGTHCCPPGSNRKCQKKSSTEKALKVTKNFAPPLLEQPLTFQEIRNEIRDSVNGKPICCSLRGNQAAGAHVVVVTGWQIIDNRQEVYIENPIGPRSLFLSYDQLVKSNEKRWRRTYKTTKSTAGGGMALFVENRDEGFEGPEPGLQIIRDNIASLFRVIQGGKPFFEVDPASVSALTPHKIYVANLDDIGERVDVLNKARLIGWRYLIFGGERPIGSVELSIEPGSKRMDFSSVEKSPGVSETFSILNNLGDRVGDDDYELRLFRVSDLDLSALWFHSYTDESKDFVKVLPPAPNFMEVGVEYSREQFRVLINRLAEDVESSFLEIP